MWISVILQADATRAEALSEALMEHGALSEMLVEGIKTNIPLHQELMLDARFMEGGTSIHYLENKLAGREDGGKK